jgi:putative ABC transport system substrate-binding protein
MIRRDFTALLGGFLLVGQPSLLGAQPVGRRARIGILILSTPQTDANTQAFRQGLRDLGYIEGQNITVEYRYADGKPERLPALAEELVRLGPDLLFVLGGDVAPHLRNATTSIPIVYAMSSDPTRAGLAATLAKPAGNATGVTFLQDELAAKRLELFKEAAPRISHAAFLWNPDHADNELQVAMRASARLGVKLHVMEVSKPVAFDTAFNGAMAAGVDSIYVVSSRLMVANMPRIADFAAKRRIPLVGGWGAWAQGGGLISYGPNVTDMVRQAAGYVDKILKGAKPGDLPVQQPTRFELVVNLKIARALELSIPEAFLLRADRVIE